MNRTNRKAQWIPTTVALSATIVIAVGMATLASAAEPVQSLDRTVLPIREPEPAVISELDARRAHSPPRFEVKAPAGAPNVVLVLIDDFGFGQASAFGGPIGQATWRAW